MKLIEFKTSSFNAKQQFERNRRGKPEMLLLPALELAQNLQSLWQDITQTSLADLEPRQQKLSLNELILKLENFFDLLAELLEKSAIYKTAEKIILRSLAEFILADLYANFANRFSELYAQLPKEEKSLLAWVERRGKKIDLMTLVISRISQIYLHAETFYLEVEEETSGLLYIAKGIRALTALVIPRLVDLQSDLNNLPQTQEDREYLFSRYISSLDDGQQILARGLTPPGSQDPMHLLLFQQGARLLAERPGSRQKIDEELFFSSPRDLLALRFSNCIDAWCHSLTTLCVDPDRAFLDKIKNLAVFLKEQFTDDRFFLNKSRVMLLEIFVTLELRKLAEAELKKAKELEKFLKELEKEPKKAKNSKKPQPSKKQKSASKPEEPAKSATASSTKLAIDVPSALSPEEQSLRALQASPDSPREKINKLDKIKAKDLKAQVNLQLARAEWLLLAKPTQRELIAQIAVLEAWLENPEYRDWLAPVIAKLDKLITHELPKIILPHDAGIILKELNKSLKSYLVGGFVRDAILGVESKDIDLVCLNDERDLYKSSDYHAKLKIDLVSGLRCDPSEITIKVNPHFEQLLIIVIKGFRYDVFFSKAKSLEEDAENRDFSFNAIYLDVNTKLAYAPKNAIKHCKRKKCFAINPEEFFRDPVRLLRTIEAIYLKNCECGDEGFSENFQVQLRMLKDFDTEELKTFLGSKEGHFMARFTALLDKAAQARQAELMFALFSRPLFSLLTLEQRMLLNKHDAYAGFIRDLFSHAQLSVAGAFAAPPRVSKALPIKVPVPTSKVI